MFDSTFRSGSAVHLLALLACAAGIGGYAILARRYRDEGHPAWLKKVLAGACLIAWIANMATVLSPRHFQWETSLPLFYCNWANLLGTLALLTRHRLINALLYYWACGLSVWAFITPTLEFGPAHIGFWVFWAYHLCIALAVCHLLVADRYRPTIADWWKVSAITIGYGLALVPVNVHWGWNYAFLGPGKPQVVTPIDILGEWPLRLAWIALLATGLFLMLTLPWLRRHQPRTQDPAAG